MPQIYRCAKKVVIWLGCADEELVRAMGQANYRPMSIGSEWYASHGNKTFHLRSDVGVRTRTMARINDCMAAKMGGRDRQWRHFDRLVGNRYWERALRLPEFVLAKDLKIVSGTSSISLRHFLNAYFAVMTNKAPTQDNSRLATFITGRTYKRETTRFRNTDVRREMTLSDLLALLEGCPGICEKQVDSIYSLLGLIEGDCMIRPDYSKDARDLYRHVFICEWDMITHAKVTATLIARRLALDPEVEWEHLLSCLGLHAGCSYDEKTHQYLQKAVQSHRGILPGRKPSLNLSCMLRQQAAALSSFGSGVGLWRPDCRLE